MVWLPVAGLPEADDIAPESEHRDLDLFHPWAVDSEQAVFDTDQIHADGAQDQFDHLAIGRMVFGQENPQAGRRQGMWLTAFYLARALGDPELDIQGEGRASARSGGGGQRPAHGLGQGARDRQPKAPVRWGPGRVF